MDRDARLAFVRMLELSQQTARNRSGARILSLRIHDALLQSKVPGFLEAFEFTDGNLLGELTAIKDKLSLLLGLGIESIKRVCTR
jgi:hypothetical protein